MVNACLAKTRQDSGREASSFDSGSSHRGKKLHLMIIAVENTIERRPVGLGQPKSSMTCVM